MALAHDPFQNQNQALAEAILAEMHADPVTATWMRQKQARAKGDHPPDDLDEIRGYRSIYED